MLNETETCIQLLEIIDQQEEMISKQNQTIKSSYYGEVGTGSYN